MKQALFLVFLCLSSAHGDIIYAENWHIGTGPSSMPRGLGFGTDGNLYLAENQIISRISPSRQYSAFTSVGSIWMGSPSAITFDLSGNLITVDTKKAATAPFYTVKQITSSAVITVHSQNNAINLNGDPASGGTAVVQCPIGAATDSSGNLYFADRSAGRIVRRTTTGTVSVWISRTSGASFSDGSGSSFFPTNLNFDMDGFMIVSDAQNRKVWRISANGTTATLLLALTDGFSSLYDAIRLGRSDLYMISDFNNHRVRRFDRSTGVLTDVITNSLASFPSGQSTFANPMGITADDKGNVFVTEGNSGSGYRIRRAIRCGYTNSQWDATTRTCSCTGGTGFNLNTYTCSSCTAGTYSINGTCQACPANTYFKSGSCLQCPTNAVCSSGTFTCNAGYKSNSLGTDCEACPLDQESSADRLSCQSCNATMYRPSTSSVCINCPSNAICSNGSFLCKSGFEFNTTLQQCTQCAAGFVSSSLNSTCFQCPPGSNADANQTTCLSTSTSAFLTTTSTLIGTSAVIQTTSTLNMAATTSASNLVSLSSMSTLSPIASELLTSTLTAVPTSASTTSQTSLNLITEKNAVSTSATTSQTSITENNAVSTSAARSQTSMIEKNVVSTFATTSQTSLNVVIVSTTSVIDTSTLPLVQSTVVSSSEAISSIESISTSTGASSFPSVTVESTILETSSSVDVFVASPLTQESASTTSSILSIIETVKNTEAADEFALFGVTGIPLYIALGSVGWSVLTSFVVLILCVVRRRQKAKEMDQLVQQYYTTNLSFATTTPVTRVENDGTLVDTTMHLNSLFSSKTNSSWESTNPLWNNSPQTLTNPLWNNSPPAQANPLWNNSPPTQLWNSSPQTQMYPAWDANDGMNDSIRSTQ